MSDIPRDVLRAIQKHGPKLDKLAQRQYGISGTTLLAKLTKGESDYGRNWKSSAGAQGWFQFMPGTRQAVLQRYGVDPWRSPDEGAKAAVLHLTGKLGHRTGLAGYNPGGGQSYVSYILGQKVNLDGSTAAPSGRRAGTQTTSYASPSMPSSPDGLANLLREMQRPQVGVGSIAPPSFAASPVMPKNAFEVPSVGGGGVSGGVTDAIQQAMGMRGPELGGATTTPSQQQSGGTDGGVSIGANGKLVGKPIDRAGVPTKAPILKFASKIAGIYGAPIRLGTGTQHDRLTSNGNVSNHWNGYALDLPSAGKPLTKMGQSALIAAGMNPKQARNVKGGLFNVGPYQIIFNTTQGGNHYDHLHIGIRGR